MIPQRHRPRGAALAITMILLLVLAVLGTAAVSLAARDRINASSQARYQRLVDCAAAAQALIWTQIASYGQGYIGSSNPIAHVTLPDGTQLITPSHYDQDPGTTFANVTYSIVGGGGAAAGGTNDDRTNVLGGRLPGRSATGPTLVTARCIDPVADALGNPRQYEVEMTFVFGL